MSTTTPSKTAGGAGHSRSDHPASRSLEHRKPRLAPLWPEWNDIDVNAESWEVGSGRKKETGANRARLDTKSASLAGTHGFDDPEGKIELPPTLKVEQWKRPVDFLPPERPPVIVDPDHGMQNFDLVTPNEHIHFNETMRNIISQITALWDICRRERKPTNTPSENITEPNAAVLSGRTWRPWEHIYALNKVSRQPFITPYNPAGKYAIRLFFLGAWRKIIVDDTIPFDSKNRCLLPQTSLSYELWPILLSKGLLKIISLDYRSSSTSPTSNETSIIHTLTGWLPEPIPLQYTHAGKVWEFLRYDRSNKLVFENESSMSKIEQHATSPLPTFGPVPLFKWPDTKTDVPEESTSSNANDPIGHQDDSGTETLTKKSDEKSAKKAGAPAGLTVPKDATTKATTGKESRTGGGAGKDSRRFGGAGRGGVVEDPGAVIDDQTIPEAPKMIVFANIPHLQPARISAYSEIADRSERLRRYNLNDTFSSSMLLTSIRDIPLEPPPPPEYVPPWKLIRPKKSKTLPHAEPFTPREPKPERWIEIASPYINYPSPSALNMNMHTPVHGTTSRLTHSAGQSTVVDVPDIIEVDEDEDAENGEGKPEIDIELVQGDINSNLNKKDELISPTKETNVNDTPGGLDDSLLSAGSKLRQEKSADKNKANRRTTASKLDLSATKGSSDVLSVKSRAGESEQNILITDIPATGNNNNNNHTEQQDSQSKINDANASPKIIQPIKKAYTTPKIWMDFEDFCSCFTSIIVFHNPRGYQFKQKHTELKNFAAHQPTVASIAKEKKKDANAPASQQVPNLQDEKSPLYLFVDSTRESLDKKIELIVSLTSLSRWHDSGQNEAAGLAGPTIPTIPEKSGRNTGLSNDKTAADVSPARGIASKHRASIIDHSPQPIVPHVSSHDGNLSEMPQKELIPQPGSLIAEIYSWKSLSLGQPILRLHTTATKAAFLTLPPGRHVLKFIVACPLAYHLHILSDTNEFTFGDEDHLLSKIVLAPEDTEFIARAEDLFLAFDDTVQNFNNMDLQDKKLTELFRSYCDYAPQSANLTVQKCWNVFNEALFATFRTIFNGSGILLNADTQFAWRCFTNDLTTPDIMGVFETLRPVTSNATRNSARPGNVSVAANPVTTGATATSKKGGGVKDKGAADEKTSSKQQPQLTSSVSIPEIPEEPLSEWLNRELTANEVEAIVNIQKSARGFLQRRIMHARTPGTEKNLLIQRALQSTMTILKNDITKSAILLFRNMISLKPQLIQCFQFRNDDWNMVTYHDYQGQYQEQPANTWFTLFREIFYVSEEGFIAGKLLAHAQNSLLRVINNDTYDEMPLVFNRLAPAIFTKNKLGYTFFAEGISLDQPLLYNRYRLRLITSYTHLPEPRIDQLTSAFVTKEIKDYYVPNKGQVICRYRVTVADDVNQTGRPFHLASIQFNTSKSDVLMRLTILNNNEEVVSVEGKGNVVLPAILFMRDVTNTANNAVHAPPPPATTTTTATTSQVTPRPTSKSGGKKDGNKTAAGNTNRGSITESSPTTSSRTEKDKSGSGSSKRSRSSSRTGVVTDEEEKIYKYIIQVTLLRKSWPLTPTQWQFVEQLKEQAKNELKIFKQPPPTTKADGTAGGAAGGTGAAGKRAGQGTGGAAATGKAKGAAATAATAAGTGKGGATAAGRPGTGKGRLEKPIDTTKAHWILRVVSDADKADELTIKKDTERNEELINTKKAWESVEAGRAQKAMQARQKFLDSLQPKAEERPLSATTDTTTKQPESGAGDKKTNATAPSTVAPSEQQPVTKQTPAATTKKSVSSTGTKKGAAKDDAAKQAELAAAQQEIAPPPPPPPVDEPLLDEPPPTKPKIILPPLDVKPFMKQKMLAEEPIILDSLFEQEELRRRQTEFLEYAKYTDEIRHDRTEDHSNRYKEKIRQLEEYVDLQAKIDQFRRTVNEPREAFRQRFLEVERKRLAELAAQEQELIAAAEKAKAPVAEKGKGKGKGSAGKKGKK